MSKIISLRLSDALLAVLHEHATAQSLSLTDVARDLLQLGYATWRTQHGLTDADHAPSYVTGDEYVDDILADVVAEDVSPSLQPLLNRDRQLPQANLPAPSTTTTAAPMAHQAVKPPHTDHGNVDISGSYSQLCLCCHAPKDIVEGICTNPQCPGVLWAQKHAGKPWGQNSAVYPIKPR